MLNFIVINQGGHLIIRVPQRSILWPLLFNFYMLPLGQILQNNNSYAEDTLIYQALSPSDLGPFDFLCQCLQ